MCRPPVPGEQIGILVASAEEEPGRALDVAEEERDRSRRQVAHGDSIAASGDDGTGGLTRGGAPVID
jgi:hypothetical protein